MRSRHRQRAYLASEQRHTRSPRQRQCAFMIHPSHSSTPPHPSSVFCTHTCLQQHLPPPTDLKLTRMPPSSTVFFFRRRRRVGQNAAAHSYTPRASNRVGGRPPATTNRLSGLAGGCLQPASTHINEISDRDHCAWLARHGDAKAGQRARPVSA